MQPSDYAWFGQHANRMNSLTTYPIKWRCISFVLLRAYRFSWYKYHQHIASSNYRIVLLPQADTRGWHLPTCFPFQERDSLSMLFDAQEQTGLRIKGIPLISPSVPNGHLCLWRESRNHVTLPTSWSMPRLPRYCLDPWWATDRRATESGIITAVTSVVQIEISSKL